MKTKIKTYSYDGFIDFCKERENIRDLKNSGKEQPWTKDIILSSKKFCNIDRKDDRMTIEFLNVIKNKPIDYQIIGAIMFRATTSGSEVPKYLDKFSTLKDLIKDFSSEKNSLIQYNKGKPNPYQFVSYMQDFTIRRYIIENIFKNSKEIINYIKSCDKVSLIEATNKICELLKFSKNLFFITFQGVADISYLLPKNIDEFSIPYYGIGSKSALNYISKKDNITKEDLLNKIQKETGYTLLKIEHGLCEYDKYCKFKLGIKNFQSNTNNYKTMENKKHLGEKLSLMGMYGKSTKIEEKANSIAQQRLMAQAYALKKGEIELKDINIEFRDKIEQLSKSISLKDLKDFAETKHKNLPIKIENFKYIKEVINSLSYTGDLNLNFYNPNCKFEDKEYYITTYIRDNFNLIFSKENQKDILNHDDYGCEILDEIALNTIDFFNENITLDKLIKPYVDIVILKLKQEPNFNELRKKKTKYIIEYVYDFIMEYKNILFNKKILSDLDSDLIVDIATNVANNIYIGGILKFEDFKSI